MPHTLQTILLFAMLDYDAVIYQDIPDINLDFAKKYKKEAQSSQYTFADWSTLLSYFSSAYKPLCIRSHPNGFCCCCDGVSCKPRLGGMFNKLFISDKHTNTIIVLPTHPTWSSILTYGVSLYTLIYLHTIYGNNLWQFDHWCYIHPYMILF